MSELPEGTHSFNFSYRLPIAIGGSFQGGSGSVKHYAKAEVCVPLGSNKTSIKPYTINNIHDLNIDLQARVSISSFFLN